MLWTRSLGSAGAGPPWLISAEAADDVRRRDLASALLRGLFTESPFLIDVFDTRLRFVAQNKAQRYATGFPGDFHGRTMREIAPAGLMDLEALEARQRQVLDTGRALVGSEVHGRIPDDPDRDHIWSETIVPLHSRSGAVIGLTHAVFDISEQARARERLALVNEASRRIGSTLDVAHTAQELTDVAVPQLADLAYVNLTGPVFSGEEPAAGPVDEDVELRRAATTTQSGGPLETGVATGDGDPFASGPGSLFTRAIRSGTSLLLTGAELYRELRHADPARAALSLDHGVRSWLLVPMYARGAVLGAAVFVRLKRAHPFEPDDVLLAEEIVARAAVCIDNARRYTRERTTALALQRSLLPQALPVLGAAELRSRYLSARDPVALGGAWFDAIPLSGARVALVVGDVKSHGLHSAVTMGRLRTAVRTLADLDLSPEELLAQLDDLVSRFTAEQEQDAGTTGATGATDRAEGTTCVYAVFDPLSRRCVVVRAGHPPPVRVGADGRATLLDASGGPALGLGGAPFGSCEVVLDEGDLLVLSTEGLLASQGAGATAGSEALLTVLSEPRLVSAGLDGVCDAVLQQLLPVQLHDDVALLVARVHGLAPDRHVTWDIAAAPEDVGRARALANQQLAAWGLDDLSFATELVVSELVTNAIRYGCPPIQLRLIRDQSLICEVSDGSSTSPHVRRALETDEGGRGLYMAAQLVARWGTRYHPRGKTIWTEQPLPEQLTSRGCQPLRPTAP
ncbi:SpoIIE family protein phosphatase [Streptacidiphilus sp. PAMC 29251]